MKSYLRGTRQSYYCLVLTISYQFSVESPLLKQYWRGAFALFEEGNLQCSSFYAAKIKGEAYDDKLLVVVARYIN